MANYKIISKSWNGFYGKIQSYNSYPANSTLRATFHGEYYFVVPPVSVGAGAWFDFYSDCWVMRDGAGVVASGYYYFTADSGYGNLGTVTDATQADQYYTATLHDLSVTNTELSDIKLKLEANAAGDLTFTVPATHSVQNAHSAHLQPMVSLVVVYEDNNILWQGRLTSKTENLDGSIDCAVEGLLACTNDAYIYPFDYSDNNGIFTHTYVDYLIAQHYFSVAPDSRGWMVDEPMPINEVRVYPFKRWFSRGELDDLNQFGYIFRSDSEYSNLLTLLKEGIVSPLGGFFYLTYTADATQQPPALNYTDDISNIGTDRVVRFGENLKDFQIDKDCSDFFTHLKPLGKLANTADYEGTSTVDGRFTLTYDATNRPLVDGYGCIKTQKVLGGAPYQMVKNMHRVIRVEQFDDCTTQDGLYNAAVKCIASLNLDWTYTVDAVDMNIIDSAQQGTPIHIGDNLKIFLFNNQTSTPNFQAVVLGINLNISKPWESTYTIGNYNNKQITRGISQ